MIFFWLPNVKSVGCPVVFLLSDFGGRKYEATLGLVIGRQLVNDYIASASSE